ncbi:MAG TPA: baseplate J/gp47 family protein [Vicinamibacterales bacterium]|nr:baseplate J/gp47 family protein [Vicinamibacterales bacterium]
MADIPSRADLFSLASDQALIVNGALSPDVVNRPGSDANILFAGASAIGDEVIGQVVDVEAALYLGSASGSNLDRLVYDRYGLIRKAAAPALGQVQFTTATTNPAPFNIVPGTLLQTATGVQFIVTVNALFPAGTSGPITATVQSTLAGFDQQASIGSITSIISSITGAPNGLTVTNAQATMGAADAESDDSLRNRAQQFFVTARRGTKSAIVQGALAVPGVQTASVYEVLDANGYPARVVELVITDSFTTVLANLNQDPPNYQAQANTLAMTVFNSLDDYRAAGIYVDVIVASVVLLRVTLLLSYVAGSPIDPSTVASQAQAAIVNYMNSLSPGQPFVYLDAEATLKTIAGLAYTGNEIVVPSGNVVTTSLQVLRTPLELVAVGNP